MMNDETVLYPIPRLGHWKHLLSTANDAKATGCTLQAAWSLERAACGALDRYAVVSHRRTASNKTDRRLPGVLQPGREAADAEQNRVLQLGVIGAFGRGAQPAQQLDLDIAQRVD